MSGRESRLERLGALREAGRHAEALALLRTVFGDIERAEGAVHASLFVAMLEWEFLVDAHPPARAALEHVRDDQAHRLLAGDTAFGGTGRGVPGHAARFALVADMNRILGDARSTYDIFKRLDAAQPDEARLHAVLALPAVIEAGDFALADRYLGEPLAHLDEVNETAAVLPLFPPAGQAPRLAAELSNLVKDVRLAMAVLRGRGREADAGALRDRLLDGLLAAPLRALALRELEVPGTIIREVVARQMTQQSS